MRLDGACNGVGRSSVLIDALFGDSIAGYPVVPPALRAEMETADGSGKEAAVALATHFHGDHFDAEAVSRYLTSDPEAHFVSTPQALAQLQTVFDGSLNDGPLSRADARHPADGATEVFAAGGARIEVLNLHHGRRQPPVENLGFIISLCGQRVIHFGDTEAKYEEFEPYIDRLADVDVALLPFWFLTSSWRVEMVRKELRPRLIVVLHLPLPEAPASYFGRWENYDGVVGLVRSAFSQALIPTLAGQRFAVPPPPVNEPPPVEEPLPIGQM